MKMQLAIVILLVNAAITLRLFAETSEPSRQKDYIPCVSGYCKIVLTYDRESLFILFGAIPGKFEKAVAEITLSKPEEFPFDVYRFQIDSTIAPGKWISLDFIGSGSMSSKDVAIQLLPRFKDLVRESEYPFRCKPYAFAFFKKNENRPDPTKLLRDDVSLKKFVEQVVFVMVPEASGTVSPTTCK